MRPLKYSCTCCGAPLDVNPVLIRIPCTYCGRVFINTTPITLEQIEKNQQILNTYDVKLVLTDSNVVVTNAISIGNNRPSGGTEDVLGAEAMLSVLGNLTHKEYIITSNTPVIRKYERKLNSCDKKTWKPGIRTPMEVLSENRIDYMTKYNLSRSLMDTYEVYRIDNLLSEDEKCIRKAGILNPAVYERTEHYEQYYSVQKNVRSSSTLRSGFSGEMKTLIDRMGQNESVVDIVARIRDRMQAAKDMYVCRDVPTSLFVGAGFSIKGVTIGSWVSDKNESYVYPLTIMNNHTICSFKSYGREDLNEERVYQAFILAVVKEVEMASNEWRLYSLLKNHTNDSILVGFMNKKSFKPEYKKWV